MQTETEERVMHCMALLETEVAAELISQSPKDGSMQSLTDYALQTTYLRGQLAAIKSLRDAITTPTTRENES